MTAAAFRALALSFPEAIESSHMDHPDFRIRKKIFATLTQDERQGMVKLTPEQQAIFLRSESEVVSPAAGAWGRRGCTMIQLADANEESIRQALELAWRNTAPKELLEPDAAPPRRRRASKH